MKKTIAVILVIAMLAALVLGFAGCNNKNKSEQNSVLLANALDKLVEADALHIAIEDVELDIGKSEVLEIGGITMSVKVDMYLKKVASGYDIAITSDVVEKSVKEVETEEYTNVTAYHDEFYLVGNRTYELSKIVSQTVLNGKGYASYSDAKSNPDKNDSKLIEGFVTDWSGLEATLVSDNGSRVDTSVDVNIVNTLDGAIAQILRDVPVFEQLKLTSIDQFVSLIERALDSMKKIEGGSTKKNGNGGYTVKYVIDKDNALVETIEKVIAEAKSTVGVAIDNILEQESGYANTVIDRLFVAEGEGLSFNAFIAALEEILAENGVDITVKEIVDEIQTILGLSAQEIADIIKPLIKEMAGVSLTLNANEGETLYDMLERAVFDTIGIDTVIQLVSEEPTMNSNTVNAMLKAMIYGEEAMTVEEALYMFLDSFAMFLTSLTINDINLEIGLDVNSANQLTGLDVQGFLDTAINAPTGSGDATETTTLIKANVSAKASVEYTVDDSAMTVNKEITDNFIEKEIGDKVTFKVNQGVSVSDLLTAMGCEFPVGAYVEVRDVFTKDENGYYNDFLNSVSTGTIISFYSVPEEIETVYFKIRLDGKVYLFSLEASKVQAA